MFKMNQMILLYLTLSFLIPESTQLGISLNKIDNILIVMESNYTNRVYFEGLEKSMKAKFDQLEINNTIYVTPEFISGEEERKINFNQLDENTEPLFGSPRHDSIRARFKRHLINTDNEIKSLVKNTSPDFIMIIKQIEWKFDVGIYELRLFDTSNNQLLWKIKHEVPAYKKSYIKASKEIFGGLEAQGLL